MKRGYRRWAECEDRYLKEHYTDGSITVRCLADILKRTEGAVSRRASQLGQIHKRAIAALPDS